MASKATINRQKSSEKVLAAGSTHKQKITMEMASIYGPETASAAYVLVDKVMNHLGECTQEMVARDDAHEQELRDDPEVRDQRDQVTQTLYERLVQSRQQLGAVMGADYVAKLGFQGTTSPDPVAVHRLAGIVAENLEALPPPEPLLPGYQFDPSDWVTPITDSLTTLDYLITTVAEEEREAEATLTAKRQAIEAYDEAFSNAANLLSSLLNIAGEKELAKRVRPSTRRPGQTKEDASPEGSTPRQ